MLGVPRAGGSMSVSDTEHSCCMVSVGGGAVGCAGDPCRTVARTGDAIVGSFAWPWASNFVANSTVIRNGPCWSGVGDA